MAYDNDFENSLAIDQPSLYRHFPEAEATWTCCACKQDCDRVETPPWSRHMRSQCCLSVCYRSDP